MTSWDEIKGKMKHAYEEIESAYEKVESSVDKVKERRALNTTVKVALPLIPIIGPTLSAIYNNIGGGTKSEEDRAKEVLDFLSELEQKNEEQFDRLAEDLKSNSQSIIDAINQNKIEISALITNSWKEIVDALHGVQKTADVTLDKVETIAGGVERIQQSILEQRPSPSSEYKRPPKPTFRGKSRIFVGRKEDIAKIKQYLIESNAPISIVGEGGIGKSALAFKAIHECEDMFDVIIPLYFESLLTFNSFLLQMAKSVQLAMTIDKFEQLSNDGEKAQIIKDALGGHYGRALIYADNYETVTQSILNQSVDIQQSRQEEEKEQAVNINDFLEEVPENTYVLLTSQRRRNLAGERTVPLEGLSVEEGYDLFIKVAGDKLPKNIQTEMKEAIEEISKKTAGHPLSIEILATIYEEILLPELRDMLQHLGAGVVNPRKGRGSRHKSLKASFEYSISKLPTSHKLLLPKLATMFKSPFPSSAVEYIFDNSQGSSEAVIRDLHNSSLLRRISFGEYGDAEGKYSLYHFHPLVRNYLENEAQGNRKEQENGKRHHEQFSLSYLELLEETYKMVGTKDHALTLEVFDIIYSSGMDNDFDRATRLTNDQLVVSSISSYMGSILYILGRHAAALKYYFQSLEINKELKDSTGIAKDYRNIGKVLRFQGNYDQALNYYRKALTIHEDRKDSTGIAKDYRNIGKVLRAQGNYDQALESLHKALTIDDNIKNEIGIAKDYRNIGKVLRAQGNYDQALEFLNKALRIFEDLQDKIGTAKSYKNIGSVLVSQGTHNEALSYYGQALKIYEDLKDSVEIAKVLESIGVVLGNLGDTNGAIESFSKGVKLLKEREEKTGFHHPLRDKIQRYISELQKKKEDVSNPN